MSAEKVGFWRSSGGRIAIGASGLAVLGAGGVALGDHSLANAIIASVPPLVAVGFIVAIGLSLEDYGAHCLALLLALPPLGGVFLFSLAMLGRGAGALGWVLVALGLAALARALMRGAPASAGGSAPAT